MTLQFSALTAATPTPETLAATYAALNARLDSGDIAGAVAEWETARRAVEDWSALTHLRFEQDTEDAARKAALDYRDELSPTITNHETTFKTRLLTHANREAVEKAAGTHALRLWETDITTFSPEIECDLQEESKLQSRYTALLASAKIEIEGKTVNLSGLAPYQQSHDRALRHKAEQARWDFFSKNAEAFDEIYRLSRETAHQNGAQAGVREFCRAWLPPHAPGGLFRRRCRRLSRAGAAACHPIGASVFRTAPRAGRLGQAPCLG